MEDGIGGDEHREVPHKDVVVDVAKTLVGEPFAHHEPVGAKGDQFGIGELEGAGDLSFAVFWYGSRLGYLG